MGNVVNTIADTVTDNKRYYPCPRCGRKVWAYGSFVGNVCLDCPGTVISAIGSTGSMITHTPHARVVSNSVASEVTQTLTAVGGVVGNVATLNVSSNGNGREAEYQGTKVFVISKGNVSEWPDSTIRSKQILSITSKSVGIRGALSNGTGFDHWWMNINASGKYYYQIQFQKDGSGIIMRECDSISECDETGLAEARRDENISPNYESSWSKSGIENRTLGDLVSWIESGGFSSTYSLYNNNCQDLCKSIYRWI